MSKEITINYYSEVSPEVLFYNIMYHVENSPKPEESIKRLIFTSIKKVEKDKVD